MTKISVAMTTYNGEKYIIEQLQSIRDQQTKVSEVIICDDRSTDSTVELISKYIYENDLHNWSVSVNESCLGCCNNFWRAIGLCKGEVIFLCDQDDIWYSNKVQESLDVMFADPNRVLVASMYDTCDERGDINDINIITSPKVFKDGLLDITLNQLAESSFIPGSSICFKKKILKDEQLFMIDNGIIHDWIICLYSTVKGQSVITEKKLYKYRIHSQNTSFTTMSDRLYGARKTCQRRLSNLQSQSMVLEYFYGDKRVQNEPRVIIEKMIEFTNLRILLLTKFSWACAFKLLSSLVLYAKVCRAGKMYGFRLYAADIYYSISNK